MLLTMICLQKEVACSVSHQRGMDCCCLRRYHECTLSVNRLVEARPEAGALFADALFEQLPQKAMRTGMLTGDLPVYDAMELLWRT